MRYLCALALLASVACGSAVETAWVKAGYQPASETAIKRIVVAGWAPAEHERLAQVLSTVASDRIKLKMNYLVFDTAVLTRGWSDACGEAEGVLSIHALDVKSNNDDLGLHVVAELHSCKTGALVWRAEGLDDADPGDEDLTQLTQSYVSQLGADAARYAVAVFLVLRDMLETLPDPTLTDDDILEKIELGGASESTRGLRRPT